MPRDATILIRLTKEEKAQINAVAAAAGESISVWVRQTLREKAGMAGLNSPAVPESSPLVKNSHCEPVKVNGEPPLDIPEIPLNDPQVAPSVQPEPPVESGYWLDGEWVPD